VGSSTLLPLIGYFLILFKLKVDYRRFYLLNKHIEATYTVVQLRKVNISL